MKQCTIQNEHLSISSRDVLTEILRHGAQEMLAQAIENEVAEYVEAHAHTHDDQGRRLVVRNGYLPSRTIRTGVGPVDTVVSDLYELPVEKTKRVGPGRPG